MASTKNNGQLFQLSTMSSLLDGVFEGAMSYDEIKEYGDFGIGTFEHLDGEMIAFDGQFYRLRGDGTATPLKSEDMTPFCSLTYFQPTVEKKFEQPLEKAAFENELKKLMASENLFYAFRIDGVFKEVSTRTVAYQEQPIPMIEAVKSQPIFHFKNVKGTIVGFWSPAYTQGIAVSGFHLHFIDEERKGGGHVFDYSFDHGTVQIDKKSHMSLYTPETEGFLKANLSRSDLEKEIKVTEG
ncbi:acetolactate decarboxylase [Sporolactobacillus laevolacticus]|uniref:Alpha-acetolactate decarboxylase n=1 Tax=Sporolactobacillus laevolacticus DSM 442 TaxID=1395513 RepID=V6IZB6_9BACL|nr:acetolactate decarboxylase [Sporolactobacillus laevolacticus]EST12805.1 alpha-acetolactate decarboxylase [Sporolactobacillus laevolacticus DSM 442]